MTIKTTAWLPGVPSKDVLARYRKAPGKELDAKFSNPESSANLVANAFGWFMGRAKLLPALPGCERYGMAEDVCVERCMRFPWRGGLHPWLDVVIETPKALIGVESKRYEPFRPKAAGPAPWSEAYSRDVWGAQMGRFKRMRELLASGQQVFTHLDAVQLVKHAYGLRTQACKDGQRKAVLVYLYAEPTAWPDGRAVPASQVEKHRSEVDTFANAIAGDEVTFHSASYGQVLESWSASKHADIKAHVEAVRQRYDVSRTEAR